jgi:hypothetical protein
MPDRPYVYLTAGSGRRVQWVRDLLTSEGFYEGRATHCLRGGDFLYVLVQLDKYAASSVNKAVLRVVKLELQDGSKVLESPVEVPGAGRGYSAWVWGDDDFRQVGDKIIVDGSYRYVDAEESLPFSAEVPL